MNITKIKQKKVKKSKKQISRKLNRKCTKSNKKYSKKSNKINRVRVKTGQRQRHSKRGLRPTKPDRSPC